VILLRGHWQLIALTALVAALWTTPVIVPLKILVVFLHEGSHALAALVTGGSVEAITLSPREGGTTLTLGGNAFVLMSAGYLGSLLIGVALFLAALRGRADRWVMAGMGALMLLTAALYMRESFALIFTLVTGTALLTAARFLPHQVADLTLRVIGLTSMIYVPLDIFSDTIARAHLPSDAHMLAQTFGGTTVMWGGLWLILSLATVATTLRYATGSDSNITLRTRPT